MSFEEFQSQSRHYVIGALESKELEEFEIGRKKFGKRRKISSRNVTYYMKH
jgi:hypothetical protein